MPVSSPPTSPAIVSIGEPLIEFNRPKEGDGRTWLQGFGGDSQNVAIAAARQGTATGYITSVGQDWMGDAFLDLWKAEGVDASCVSRHPTAPTGVSFVTHSAQGHKFDYLRKNSAASLMQPGDMPKAYIAGAKFFHVSAIGQAISANAREAIGVAMDMAKAAGVKVSYDTNLRLRLWELDLGAPGDPRHLRALRRAAPQPRRFPAAHRPCRTPRRSPIST